MKCRKCRDKAVINMRQHRLALCKGHYLDWLPEQIEKFIKKYSMFTLHDRILVAVSGGKDSLALWDVLIRLGYQADGLYIGLGIEGETGYSEQSQLFTEQFAGQRGLNLHVESIPQNYGLSIPEMSERTLRGKKPCSVCGLTKRHVMNRVARDGGYNVLATGHNLDDEAAVLFGNTLQWLSGYLVRQGPVLEANHPGLARKVKPLCRFYERDMAAYALLRGIEYVYDECPYAVGAKSIYYKEVLNKLEAERPGAKLTFYLSFLKAKKKGLFAPDADTNKVDLHTCPTCGQPTTAPKDCAFCRLTAAVSTSD